MILQETLNMNPEKLKRLEKEVRVGGKGTPRRKKKVVKKTTASSAAFSDKVMDAIEEKLPFELDVVPDIDGVEIVKEDGSLTFISNPKVEWDIGGKRYCVAIGSAGNKLEFAPRDVPFPKHPFVKLKVKEEVKEEVKEADNLRPRQPTSNVEEDNRERAVIENLDDDPRRRCVLSRF